MAKGKSVEALITDPDVPGLVRPSSKAVRERRVGNWIFQSLADGTLFVSHWRGENMVGHELFSEEEAALILGVLAG